MYGTSIHPDRRKRKWKKPPPPVRPSSSFSQKSPSGSFVPSTKSPSSSITFTPAPSEFPAVPHEVLIPNNHLDQEQKDKKKASSPDLNSGSQEDESSKNGLSFVEMNSSHDVSIFDETEHPDAHPVIHGIRADKKSESSNQDDDALGHGSSLSSSSSSSGGCAKFSSPGSHFQHCIGLCLILFLGQILVYSSFSRFVSTGDGYFSSLNTPSRHT